MVVCVARNRRLVTPARGGMSSLTSKHSNRHHGTKKSIDLPLAVWQPKRHMWMDFKEFLLLKNYLIWVELNMKPLIYYCWTHCIQSIMVHQQNSWNNFLALKQKASHTTYWTRLNRWPTFWMTFKYHIGWRNCRRCWNGEVGKHPTYEPSYVITVFLFCVVRSCLAPSIIKRGVTIVMQFV